MKPPVPPFASTDHAAADELPDFLRRLPRRPPRTLSEPPPGYFDELPVRVLTRIRAEAPRPALAAPALWPSLDLSRLRWPRLRVAFAGAALSAAFVAAFWLGTPPALAPTTAATADPALANVDAAELVEYLADPATVRLTAADLTTLSTAEQSMAAELLAVPGAALDAALDELPLDAADAETYL